jgi:TPR repeat protein
MTIRFVTHLKRALLPAAVLLLAGLLPISGAHAAGEYERGKQAYKASDYASARQIWMPLALRGETRAQYSIGLLYEKGQGVEQDLSTALSWYRKAAEQNHADSQHRMAVAYAYGLGGLIKDDATAVKWLHKAASNGHRKSQRLLARIYETGELGVTPDPGKARQWSNLSTTKKN